MGKMKRCFLLGAGFSKAIAKLPLMKELIPCFDKIMREQQDQGNKQRVERGIEINRFLDYLENEYFIKPNFSATETYQSCNLRQNIEAILSYIDLALLTDISATKINEGGKKSYFVKHEFFSNYSSSALGTLEELKTSIKTYIYLTLTKPKINKELLQSFVDGLTEGDKIITFNHDLVLDIALYKNDMWRPKDGYGIEIQNIPKINPENDIDSIIQIYKLHGSLNWEYNKLYEKQMLLNFFYEDFKTPYFPKYLINENNFPLIKDSAHFGYWMLPSYIKQFNIPDILNIWQQAHNALNEADEVIIIGYSLPKGDSAACLLLGTTNISKKTLIIIDPNKNELKEKYKMITGNMKPVLLKKVEDYISNN